MASQGFTKELLLAIPHPAEGGKCNLSRTRHYDNIVTTAAKLHAQAIDMLLEFHTSSGPLQHVLLDEPTNHPVKTRSQCTTPSVLLETGVLDKITWICFTFSIYRTILKYPIHLLQTNGLTNGPLWSGTSGSKRCVLHDGWSHIRPKIR